VAVFLYQKTVVRAQSSEVSVVFYEFKQKQESYWVENYGLYLSTGTDETDTHPALADIGEDPVDLSGAPDEWTALRINIDRRDLYCGYVAIAGTPGEDVSPMVRELGFTDPNKNWYYLYAECNFDGDDSLNSSYYTFFNSDGLVELNTGF
jgi:hypothetical protein